VLAQPSCEEQDRYIVGMFHMAFVSWYYSVPLFKLSTVLCRDFGTEFGEEDKDLVMASTAFCNFGVKGDHTSFYLLSNINYLGQLGASPCFSEIGRHALVSTPTCR
jgi:hypothetical protein